LPLGFLNYFPMERDFLWSYEILDQETYQV